jgi:hypothetical protein
MDMSLLRFDGNVRSNLRTLRKVAHRIARLGRAASPKVFGVGLSRTGTKSLHRALGKLGYLDDHFSTHLLDLDAGELSINVARAAEYDALTDITASLFFRELDAAFPGSKFILTLREPEAWLASCKRHFPPLRPSVWPANSPRVLALRQRTYSSISFDAAQFRAAYESHRLAVTRWFADRPESLLIFDVCAGDSWPELCRFLGHPVPTSPFPWANRAH